jgi:hypothetical protein
VVEDYNKIVEENLKGLEISMVFLNAGVMTPGFYCDITDA